jgi:nitroreductase
MLFGAPYTTEEELLALLEEGRRASDEGRTRPWKEVYADLKQRIAY